jgi:hypothetical protein
MRVEIMTKHDRYIFVCHKLRERYTINGRIVISERGAFTKYARLEDLAAVKYLGCRPAKVMR